MSERIPFYDDLLKAFAEPGCAICRQLAAGADKMIDSILYESVNDPPTRELFNASLGYCLTHSQLMMRAGAALGVTIMLDNVLKILLRTLEANPVENLSPSKRKQLLRSLNVNTTEVAVLDLADTLNPKSKCPVCVHEAELFGHYGRTLLAHIAPGNALHHAYAQSDGLCLAHFRAVLATAQPGAALNALVKAQQTIWQRLHEQSQEFIRKNDHRFRGQEPFGPEKDVWLRALTAVAGAPIQTYINPKSLT